MAPSIAKYQRMKRTAGRAANLNRGMTAGDRVAYAARFLRDTGQHTGAAPQRRGTFVRVWELDPENFVLVKWDDFEVNAPRLAEQLGQDYVDDARKNGQLVHIKNIAKVGSAAFALTCAG